jgi:dGTPase
MTNPDNRILSNYATFSQKTKGRMIFENHIDERTCFQRDRDRILHSAAFRRLKHKTQVFLNEQGDYYRTRLTHTIEVSQISRSISFALNLNEDLTEAIALSHDLGHPPFGHAGEEILNEKMFSFGGFDHNEQALRILCELEKRYPNFIGLNLCWETLDGIIKHNGIIDKPRQFLKILDSKFQFDLNSNTSLEGQVAAIADDIAYLTHDFDDGLNSGILNINQIKNLPIIDMIIKEISNKFINITDQFLAHEMVRRLISVLVQDTINNSKLNIKNYNIQSVENVKHCPKPIVCFSSKTLSNVSVIRDFLLNKLWHHPKVDKSKSLGKKVISDLFDFFIKDPNILINEEKLYNNKKTMAGKSPKSLERFVADKIASLTDRNALEMHKKYFKSNYIL